MTTAYSYKHEGTAAYGVWCTVTGGVTGTRQAWLKDDGKILVYPTRAEAETAAQNAADTMARDVCGTQRVHYRATFTYAARAL